MKLFFDKNNSLNPYCCQGSGYILIPVLKAESYCIVNKSESLDVNLEIF